MNDEISDDDSDPLTLDFVEKGIDILGLLDDFLKSLAVDGPQTPWRGVLGIATQEARRELRSLWRQLDAEREEETDSEDEEVES